MAGAQIFQVDTFTGAPFAGNPAAVCLLDRPAAADWMQAVAAELGVPATSFLVEAEGGWTLRWFTVTTELEVCGHATLAAAHVLWETAALAPDETAEFDTAAGTLTATRKEGIVRLTLPAGRVTPADAPAELVAAIGDHNVSAWRTPLDYLLLLERPEAVVELEPDLDAISRIETRGVVVTAEGGEDDVDFTSRFFAPRIGLPEDSVTGSAHASLGPFWAERLGRTRLRARQASARGGYLELRVERDSVEIGGQAVTVARGELLV